MNSILKLLQGTDGHPLHPPFTDATIGAYVVATGLVILSFAGVATEKTASAWWIAVLGGLALTIPTAVTGLLDWLTITWWTPLWRTATSHLLAMVSATGVFAVVAAIGHAGYVRGSVSTADLALTLAGFSALTLGGWLGGTIVFVHGMRVLSMPDEPALKAVSPTGSQKNAR
jgi:uncharacterized membrane protein